MAEDWLAEARKRREKREEQARIEEEQDREKIKDAKEVAWLCASTDPIRDKYANEMAGRKAHAIRYLPGESTEDIRNRRSLCGKKARHGWCSDLHNTMCRRCAAKMGVDWRGDR